MRGLLLIADGTGFSRDERGNAVIASTMPFLFSEMQRKGLAILEASGTAVGLGADQTGNSEIGHLTIGAGRRLPATLTAIRAAHADGSWAQHPLWSELAARGRVHVVGLASDAGVHGHFESLVLASELALARGAREVLVHAILDGVDSRAGSAVDILAALSARLAKIEGAKLASIMGRKLACDRSGKIELARACVRALEEEAPPFDPEALTEYLRSQNESAFPCHALGPRIEAGACVLLTNHRADRTVQLARAFAEKHEVYALVELADAVAAPRVFFPTRALDRGLMFELAALGVPTVRIAEQCKFPHVTHFMNGFAPALEHRSICIPSIPEAQIREQPEMSLAPVVDAILESMKDDAVIVANLANLDQVGHLGDYALAVRAAKLIDDALRTLHTACADRGWPLLFTSDHGNADVMIDPAGRPLGSHSMNPVPLLALGACERSVASTHGTLANVAPTFLELIGARAPAWMDPSLRA